MAINLSARMALDTPFSLHARPDLIMMYVLYADQPPPGKLFRCCSAPLRDGAQDAHALDDIQFERDDLPDGKKIDAKDPGYECHRYVVHGRLFRDVRFL